MRKESAWRSMRCGPELPRWKSMKRPTSAAVRETQPFVLQLSIRARLPSNGRHVYFDRRQNRLTEPHSLESFELTQSSVECPFDTRFVSEQAIHVRPVRYRTT